MDYFYTLPEAAERLRKRGLDCSDATLLRAGMAGALLLCVPLDCKAYSTTLAELNEEAPANFANDAAGVVGRATVDLCGLYVVPPRHLLGFEIHDEVLLKAVASLNRRDIYLLNVWCPRASLRVTSTHLDEFAEELDLLSKPPAKAPPQKSMVQRDAIMAALASLGLDPQNLPRDRAGVTGAKGRVWKSLQGSPLFTGSSFKHAWDDARASGDIKTGD